VQGEGEYVPGQDEVGKTCMKIWDTSMIASNQRELFFEEDPTAIF